MNIKYIDFHQLQHKLSLYSHSHHCCICHRYQYPDHKYLRLGRYLNPLDQNWEHRDNYPVR